MAEDSQFSGHHDAGRRAAPGFRGGARQGISGTVDQDEIDRFTHMAEDWWKPAGKLAPLHRLNPTRLQFLRDHICRHWSRDPLADMPLQGLRLLDIGCGGGLVAEPLTRLGATVTGVDAGADNIAVARLHAERMQLVIDYRHTTAEALREAGESFDVVLALEVVEHVADLDLFLECCGTMVRPGGALALATMNRTAKSFALAIVGAEYVLGWVPRGTHDWRKFVKPSEAARGLRRAGLLPQEITGVVYDLPSATWRLSARDVDVNYMLFATRAA